MSNHSFDIVNNIQNRNHIDPKEIVIWILFKVISLYLNKQNKSISFEKICAGHSRVKTGNLVDKEDHLRYFYLLSNGT